MKNTECLVIDEVCETCNNSGYVFNNNGMHDCPNDDCNAFGQFDSHCDDCHCDDAPKSS